MNAKGATSPPRETTRVNVKVTRAGIGDWHGGAMTLRGSVARDKWTRYGMGYRNCSQREKSVFRGIRAHNEPTKCL